MIEVLGLMWIPALPAFVWVLGESLRIRRPALLLFGIWSFMMTAGVILQYRMVIYFGPVGAILAGVAFAGLTGAISKLSGAKFGLATGWVLAAIAVAASVWQAVPPLAQPSWPGPEWRRSLVWLQRNSPEPFDDPQVWSGLFPATHGIRNRAPVPKWGVLTWWDFGYAVELTGHRVPIANGTQEGIEEASHFFADTVPEIRRRTAGSAHARYVILDQASVVFDRTHASELGFALQILGRDMNSYLRVVWLNGVTVQLWLPEYYRTMAARLYLADGKAVTGGKPWVVETRPELSRGNRLVDVVLWHRQFETEEEANQYMNANPQRRLVLGCVDPEISCVSLPAVRGIHPVFRATARSARGTPCFRR